MDESELEGSLVLEKLAVIGKVDAFYEAIDADDFALAMALMKKAGIDSEAINAVLEEMGHGEKSF